MDRSLGLLVIGLVFGGGIGFLVAAGNGITLDGHDHGDHGGAHQATGHDAHHDMMIDLPDGVPTPTLRVAIEPDPVLGWNLHLSTENFRFAPEAAGLAHKDGEGHAHLHVNGTKIARLYGDWFHLTDLPAGAVEVEVGLYSNDHSRLSVKGEPLKQVITLQNTAD